MPPSPRDTFTAENISITATFLYDGDGQRAQGTVNGVTTTSVGSHYEVQGTTTRKYYFAGTQRIAVRENAPSGEVLSYLLADHLGSFGSGAAAITVNASGAMTGELRYSAWGETRYTWGTTPTNRRYTGQAAEPELGIMFYGARWYDPALGRFLSADTVIPGTGNPLSWDRFSYVGNNPVNRVDPTGHIECTSKHPGAACLNDNSEPRDTLLLDPNDKDALTERGEAAWYDYRWARSNRGWWNNNSTGTMTPEQFLGIFVLWEAAGNRGALMENIRDAVGYQIFMEAVKNGYKANDSNSPYCTSSVCINGMFNFVGRYQKGETDYLATRFGNLNPNNHPQRSSSKEDLFAKADEIGDYIYGNQDMYRAGDPYALIPYHWGNPDLSNPKYFVVTNMAGDIVWHN